MRGNFLDIPTDCPQRDERLGWTGDIQVFSPTACFLYDCAGFLQSWLQDLAAEQQARGGVVPNVVPDVIQGMGGAAAAWGDAAVVVPWVLYQRFGDVGVLEAQFESMRAWVDAVAERAGPGRLWDRGFQFGDWLDPSAPPDRPGDAKADRHLVATAYFARSAELLGKAAAILGKPDEAARYGALAAEVRDAFGAEYVTGNGRMLSDATTAYALAIEFGLLPEERRRRRAGERLVELVRASGYQISTGFVGTPLICDALCSAGRPDAAYRLLLQRECPSWLYPVTMGATTVWERWDSMLPDGSINPGEMTSFNHYALGAVADWMHRVIGGLAPAAPGYRELAIAPVPGGGLTHGSASHRTPYGLAACSWRRDDGQITVTATVPPNVSAVVTLPGRDREPFTVGAGTHRWQYDFRDPLAKAPATLDSPIGAVIDDAQAWAVVTGVLGELAPNLGFIRSALMAQSAVPLRQALAGLPMGPRLLEAIGRALGEPGRE
jgi:alpha-L-rhamnosidase